MGLLNAIFGSHAAPITEGEVEALMDIVQGFFSEGLKMLPSDVELTHVSPDRWRVHYASDSRLKIEVPVQMYFCRTGSFETAHPVITLDRKSLEAEEIHIPRADLFR